MHIQNIHDLLEDQRFRAAMRRKQRLSLIFASTICILFFGFILIIAFAPGVFSATVDAHGVINLYLLVSVGLILLVCVLMNLFVVLKQRDRHEDIHRLIAEIGEQPR